MVTVLDKALKRQVTIDGVYYMVSLDPEGIQLTQKGKRRPEIELHWRELVSGEAALAVALNASLTAGPTAVKAAARPPPTPAPAVPAAVPPATSKLAPVKRALRKVR